MKKIIITNLYNLIDKLYLQIFGHDKEYYQNFLLNTKKIKWIRHLRWIYWKNKFEFNIYGSNGFLTINGLGGSYGKEKLTFGIRNMKGGLPEIQKFSFSEDDNSWKKEWKFFKELIVKNEQFDNGYQANLIVDAIYTSSKKNQPVNV